MIQSTLARHASLGRAMRRMSTTTTANKPSIMARSVALARQPPLGRARAMRRRLTTTTATNKPSEPPLPSDPSSTQLRAYFWTCAVPMLGFGFMDNTIMIQAGNYIDLTLGVKFGLSTLAAAAWGQVVSMGASVVFGDTVENIARSIGLPSSGLTSQQRRLPSVRRAGFLGSFIGVVIGAALGLVNLLLVDTKQSTFLKLEARREELEFDFEVNVSNKERTDATTITIKGPDVDGLLAASTAALTAHGYSVVELHASPLHSSGSNFIEDVFVIKRGRGRVEDHELEELGRILLAACRDPLSAHSLKTQVQVLEDKNAALVDRLEIMERLVEQRQIIVEPTSLRNESGDSG